MGKILKINDDIVFIGNDDQSVTEVTIDSLDFEPKIGDEVDVFKSETAVFVSKKTENNYPESDKETSGTNDGINININNSNNNQSQTPYTQVAASGKVVSKIPYILLAIFLGGLGGHKFYSGKIGQGIVYFLLCWTYIPAAIGLIEGIVAAFKTPDVNGNIVV